MVAKVAGSRARTTGRSADVLVVGVPNESLGEDAGEISPMAKVASIVCEPDEVWFTCTTPSDVQVAAQIVQAAVGDGVWTKAKPRYLNATEAVDGVIGDLVGTLLAQGKRVVASDAAGPESVRWAIRRASGYAGIPLLSLAPQGEVYVDQLKAATPSLVLGALRFTLTAKPSDPRTTSVELHERGFTALVKVDNDDTYQRTQLLDSLLANIDLARSSDCSSACADLLERRGFPEDAQRLRDATQYWIQQRLWDANFVPEMVLHNEAHSAAVDRNVAGLCEPLLASGRLDEVDLMVLAAAAWLHDWGHASVSATGTSMATHPADVRNYHGIFTAKLLAERGTTDARHQLNDRFAGQGVLEGVYARDEDWFAKDVALLCGHHQGWTSCSDAVPDPEPAAEPDRLEVLDLDNEHRPRIASFDEDHAAYLDGRDLSYFAARGLLQKGVSEEKARSTDLGRAKVRLALLRVADAADVGVHRVPNYHTQQHARDTIAAEYLGREEVTIAQILKGRQGVPSDLPKMIGQVKEIVAKGWLAVRQRIQDGEALEKKDIDKIFKSLLHKNHWLEAKESQYPEGLDSAWRAGVKAYDYAKHLVAQAAYYEQHERVRAALPFLEAVEDRFQLVVHVVPNPSEILGAEESTRRAVRYARGIVAREWGSEIDKETGLESKTDEPSDRAKWGIGVYLSKVGVDTPVRGAAMVRSVSHELPEFSAESVTAPAEVLPVTALPHSDGGWLIGRPDGVIRSAEGEPEAGTAVLATSLCGDRVATLTRSGSLWLHNVDCDGNADKHILATLSGADRSTVLAVDGHMKVLLSNRGGALEYGVWTREVLRRFEAPEEAPFVKGFFTPCGPLLVDRHGGIHGADWPFSGSRVVDIDIIERDSGIWVAILEAQSHVARVARWGDSGDLKVPVSPRAVKARVAWVRGTEMSPLVLTITTDAGIERHQLAADGSGWES